MSDESCLSFSEFDEKANKNGRPNGSDDSYINSSSDQDSVGYMNKKAPGKIRGRRGKAKKILTPEETDGKRLLANSQERDRMDKLNSALEALRRVLPNETFLHNRKMSKIKTLTTARNYIASLSDMIRQHDATIGLHQTSSSCLYTPSNDCTNYSSYSTTPDSSLGESRIPAYHNFDHLRDQGYGSSPELFNPFTYPNNMQKISAEDQYSRMVYSPDYRESFMPNIHRAVTGVMMARPICEASQDFYTSTPLSSRSHPYNRR
ncbi:hypothetical protein LOTGIDRAFT_153930 [Lottia gigantea]|uniref:BHLH domain-containing protein n=1 Tax=Lottia gigantea TaxID=225164 RepID=V4A473_LOTGI|nr:hypothetical protein LOTGIDRAFT_153930 [Lottia gigantea]ESO91487.1 hypothetical protein LOTGIDRAFT_153930 [Lottia gigantea]